MLGIPPVELAEDDRIHSDPTYALWLISPQRAMRRVERRAAWAVARPIRGAITGRGWHRRSPTRSESPVQAAPINPAERPIGQAMTPETIDGVQSWARAAAKFFPDASAKVLTDIDDDAPVGEVRDDAKELLDDIHAKQRELER